MQHAIRFLMVMIIVVPFAYPVGADAVITGRACIIDGNTVQVGSKLKDDKCWGGIDIRLHGSIAPELNETCTDSGGKAWNCGQEAKEALASLIRVNSVACYHIDGEFKGMTPIATCISGHVDLALEMVALGMAKALHDQSNRYALEEKDAMQAKRGIWK